MTQKAYTLPNGEMVLCEAGLVPTAYVEGIANEIGNQAIRITDSVTTLRARIDEALNLGTPTGNEEARKLLVQLECNLARANGLQYAASVLRCRLAGSKVSA